MKAIQNIEELIGSDAWRQLFDLEAKQVSELVALAEDGEEKQAERARLVLAGLKQAQARSELCDIAMKEERKWLNELLLTTKYAPEKSDLKAAFYVTTNQWDKYLHEFGVEGHKDLLQSINTPGPLADRILSQIERTSDPSCVKFILELFFDKTAQSFSFKTKSGSSTKLEPRLQAVLADLKDEPSRHCVHEKWLATRDGRLAKIIRSHAGSAGVPPASKDPADLTLAIYLGLKFGKLNKKLLGKNSIYILIEACRDEDKEIREAAADALVTLKDKAAQKEVLDRLFGKNGSDPAQTEYEQGLLDRLISRFEYRPDNPSDNAIFSVLLKDWDTYSKSDPDGNLLQTIYSTADIHLRQRIANGLKESARFDWIVSVCGPHGKIKLSEMNEHDWLLLQKSLSANSSWESVWNLVPVLPASSAKRFLQRLQQVGWKPRGDDKQRFERLLSYSNKLNSDHPSIWGDCSLWKVIDIGGNLFEQLHGGAAMWESRFSFAHDGSEFFMLDRYGDLRSWGLPSCLPGRLHVEGLKPLSAIAASPKYPIMALGEVDGSVWICDLEGRKVSHKLRHELYSDAIPSRIGYLKFSQSGSFLQAGQVSPEKPGCCNNLSWNSESWQKTSYLFPPYSEVSPDNQWLLYKRDGTAFLEQLDGKRAQSGSTNISFRTGGLEFLPNSRAILRKEGGRLKVLNIPNLMQVDEVVCPSYASLMISDYANHKIACLGVDYSWTFFENPYATSQKSQKPEQDPFFLFNQTLNHSHSHGISDNRPSSLRRRAGDSQRQTLTDAGVSTRQVSDVTGASIGYEVLQGLQDSNSQYFAIVHATGKVSFWVSSLFKYAQKSAALMTEEDFSALGARLSASDTSEAEKNWIRFILELAGSYEHCAIAISESGNNYLELAQFDIELA